MEAEAGMILIGIRSKNLGDLFLLLHINLGDSHKKGGLVGIHLPVFSQSISPVEINFKKLSRLHHWQVGSRNSMNSLI